MIASELHRALAAARTREFLTAAEHSQLVAEALESRGKKPASWRRALTFRRRTRGHTAPVRESSAVGTSSC